MGELMAGGSVKRVEWGGASGVAALPCQSLGGGGVPRRPDIGDGDLLYRLTPCKQYSQLISELECQMQLPVAEVCGSLHMLCLNAAPSSIVCFHDRLNLS